MSPTAIGVPTTVGVIRWDYWSADNPRTSDLALALSQPQWRDRLPFYATHLAEELRVRALDTIGGGT